MSKNVVDFPGNKRNSQDENIQHFNTVVEKYIDVEFTTKKDREDFDESMTIFVEALKTQNFKKRKKLLKKAIEISKYNIDATAVDIITEEALTLEKRREKIENLEKEVLDYPIKNNGWENIEKNVFYMALKEYQSTFYINHNLIGHKNPYEDILEKIEYIEEINMMVVDSMKIYFKLDRKEKFDELYEKMADDVKTTPLVLFYKLLFEIREDDGEAVKTMMVMKFYNPMIEVALDSVEKVELMYENRNSEEFAEIMLSFEEIEEWLNLPYYFDYLLMLNEEIRTTDDLESEVKAQTVFPVDMAGNPAFKDIGMREIYILCDAKLVDKESFLEYTEKEVLALDGIGKKTIERLKNNGVKFKENN